MLRRLSFVVILLLTIIYAGFSVPMKQASASSLNDNIIKELNSYRSANGLPALQVYDNATVQANITQHSVLNYEEDTIKHRRVDGLNNWHSYVGDIIGLFSLQGNPAKNVISDFKASANHNKVMLSKTATHVMVGSFEGPSFSSVVILFTKHSPPPSSSPSPKPTPTPTPTPTPSTSKPVQTPTPKPVQTPTPKPIQTQTPKPVKTPTPKPIQTPTPTPTQTQKPVQVTNPAPTQPSTPTPTSKPSQPPTPTPTPNPITPAPSTPTPNPITPGDSSIVRPINDSIVETEPTVEFEENNVSITEDNIDSYMYVLPTAAPIPMLVERTDYMLTDEQTPSLGSYLEIEDVTPIDSFDDNGNNSDEKGDLMFNSNNEILMFGGVLALMGTLLGLWIGERRVSRAYVKSLKVIDKQLDVVKTKQAGNMFNYNPSGRLNKNFLTNVSSEPSESTIKPINSEHSGSPLSSPDTYPKLNAQSLDDVLILAALNEQAATPAAEQASPVSGLIGKEQESVKKLDDDTVEETESVNILNVNKRVTPKESNTSTIIDIDTDDVILEPTETVNSENKPETGTVENENVKEVSEKNTDTLNNKETVQHQETDLRDIETETVNQKKTTGFVSRRNKRLNENTNENNTVTDSSPSDTANNPPTTPTEAPKQKTKPKSPINSFKAAKRAVNQKNRNQ